MREESEPAASLVLGRLVRRLCTPASHGFRVDSGRRVEVLGLGQASVGASWIGGILKDRVNIGANEDPP